MVYISAFMEVFITLSNEKIKNGLFYAGLTGDEYRTISHSIRRNSRHTLHTASFVGSLLLFILIITSFFVNSLAKNHALYFFGFISLLAIYIITKLFLKKKPELTYWLAYALITVIFIFGIFLGVPHSPTNTAVTFCVMIFALPILFSDMPIRIDIYLAVMTIIFCVCTLNEKPKNIATIDLTNAISFMFLSIVVNYHITKSKFNGLLMRHYVEKERDTDDLTKLMTKAAFKRDAQYYIEDNKSECALLVIDIDNFKSVNDTMGHAYGDAVLRIMGECINDTFDKPSLLGRFGGDEFVILLPHKKTL